MFQHDEHGHLAVHERGEYVPHRRPRRELPPLPDFHALRHTSAMECEDAEEARDLLRDKNSNVTRTVYRAPFGHRQREALRAWKRQRQQPAADRLAATGGSGRFAELRDKAQ